MICPLDDLLLMWEYGDVEEFWEDFYYALEVKYPGGGVKSLG